MKVHSKFWAKADLDHAWHPFTDQDEWESSDPLVITRGKGAWLFDSEDRCYLDANSSIWTNIHGHSHPKLVATLQEQAATLCHSSFLGFTNDRASELARRLGEIFPDQALPRCFFSDNGSTALEVALKMSLQWSQQNGRPDRTGIIAFDHAYHGDTLGASSVGGVSRFVSGYGEAGLNVYRVSSLDDLRQLPELVVQTASAVVIEPLIQGVNQMRPWPDGMLRQLSEWCAANEIHLILDEVMTGFGRTGTMFACQQEDVVPDFLCLAKGLTGGTMPLAATLTTQEIYEGFKGGPERTFYYGHSYTGNALGCAVALASLDLFEEEKTLDHVEAKGEFLEKGLREIAKDHPQINDIRRVGLILGMDIESDGKAFCLELRKHHVLTRPILNTIVFMPPLSVSEHELTHLLEAIRKSCQSLFGKTGS